MPFMQAGSRRLVGQPGQKRGPVGLADSARRTDDRTAAERALLVLQGTAGNRAVSDLLALQRSCGPSCGCVHCQDPSGSEEGRERRPVVQRVVMPPYQPNPPWSQVGPSNPAPSCTPFSGWDAPPVPLQYARLLPGLPANRCGCLEVGTAYDQY